MGEQDQELGTVIPDLRKIPLARIAALGESVLAHSIALYRRRLKETGVPLARSARGSDNGDGRFRRLAQGKQQHEQRRVRGGSIGRGCRHGPGHRRPGRPCGRLPGQCLAGVPRRREVRDCRPLPRVALAS
jgi:hypothetical protein